MCDSIEITQIDVNDVVDRDKSRYNSNNHWVDNTAPLDYREVCERSITSRWIHNFKEGRYRTLRIDNPIHIGWMKEATKSGKVTGRFPSSFEDELELLVKQYEDPSLFDGTGYFVRTEHVSLKCGKHGAGPYTSLKPIIESTVTCVHGHTPIREDSTELVFYLIDWVNIEKDFEFRMFVHNRRLTCISQQYTTKANKALQVMPEAEFREVVIQPLIDYFYASIVAKIDHDDYTIDIALILPNGEDSAADRPRQPFFIEINCFGTQYAAGSSLFHWVEDEHLLYSDGSTVHVRFAI
jgi:hypothetical protein